MPYVKLVMTQNWRKSNAMRKLLRKRSVRFVHALPAVNEWYKSSTGWRCDGGSHFVSDAQLKSQFTCS
ncbi:unnamed protein product [Peronospora belbahrii]|uniref:Uncharacterized protein n=1 Tax=Peronospora belbahrii TaxID=622444 RepID=A0ABN8CNW1_9STRA|nr:unnamed protein product [Peronospora belbahrii]